MSEPAPLYRDTMALCGVLLEELEGAATLAPVKARLSRGALALLDFVVLALAGHGRQDRLLDADAELRTLRAQLHLAYELGLVGEDTFLDLAEQADRVGRQIGGWLKKVQRA